MRAQAIPQLVSSKAKHLFPALQHAADLCPAMQTAVQNVQAQLDAAQAHKEAGNALFREAAYDGALAEFSAALDAAPAGARECAVYHANSAACYMSIGKYEDCVASCSEALLVDATYEKALLRRMRASEKLDELENALKDARQVRIRPSFLQIV